MIRAMHHVGIVVRRLRDAYEFYRETLGLPLLKEAEVKDQRVRAALLAAGDTEIELLEPTEAGTGVARFLEQRGEGLHHVCFDVPEIAETLDDLAGRGVTLIDSVPRQGLAGEIAFLHPKSCAGVLVELTRPSTGFDVDSWLRVKRLVIGAQDPKQTASLFQDLFKLPEVMINGGPRVMLAAGRGALLVVPADEVGGGEGMVALSLQATDFPALVTALERAGAGLLKGTGEVTVDPSASHGVHLHISRYE